LNIIVTARNAGKGHEVLVTVFPLPAFIAVLAWRNFANPQSKIAFEVVRTVVHSAALCAKAVFTAVGRLLLTLSHL
jgi:hypothetical protein